MATNKELEAQLQALQDTLRAHGITPPPRVATVPEDRADYVEHGSPAHAALLGLVLVDDVEEAKKDGYYTCEGSNGSVYRLEDQVSSFMTYPDPEQIATLTLRQKVTEFEAGMPEIPADAPPMWRPVEVR